MSEMGKGIKVPISHLVLYHREIGVHGGRRVGLRSLFGLRTLQDLPFLYLANRVKDAYKGKDVPTHDGWPAQQEALRWFVELGRDAIYELDTQPDTGSIMIRHTPYQRYYIDDGHHRVLALHILGENEIVAQLTRR